VLAGLALVVISVFLPWTRGGNAENALDIPAVWLVDNTNTGTGGVSIGVVLLAVAAGTVLAAVRSERRAACKVLGLAAVAVALLFVVQLQRAFSKLDGVSLTDVVGAGVVVAAAGGAVTFFASPLSSRAGPSRIPTTRA
jgi:hypothetical protein